MGVGIKKNGMEVTSVLTFVLFSLKGYNMIRWKLDGMLMYENFDFIISFYSLIGDVGFCLFPQTCFGHL